MELKLTNYGWTIKGCGEFATDEEAYEYEEEHNNNETE